jgi:hypothetical protein
MGLVKLNDRGVRNATAYGSLSFGSMIFIKKLTSDGSDDTLSFVDGTDDVVLDSTYKEYLFIFNNIHPETDAEDFTFQGNAAGGSGYNETVTTTTFAAEHSESGDTVEAVAYDTSPDQNQGTSFQVLAKQVGNGNDESISGFLQLFNPSSTTFVKHFLSRSSYYYSSDRSVDMFVAGYFNTTTAIDEIQFKMSADEIQAGTISLYGIK